MMDEQRGGLIKSQLLESSSDNWSVNDSVNVYVSTAELAYSNLVCNRFSAIVE